MLIKTPFDDRIAALQGQTAQRPYLQEYLARQRDYRQGWRARNTLARKEQAQLVDSLRALYTLVASNWPGDKVKILAKAQATLVATMPIKTPYDEERYRAAARGLAREFVDVCNKREGWIACVKALKATGVEWSSPTSTRPDGDYCPICGSWKSAGHTPDCALAAILKSVEKETDHATT